MIDNSGGLRECSVCLNKFYPENDIHKYCRDKCRVEASNKNTKERYYSYKEIAKLTATVKKLREALEFYANGTNYNFHSTSPEKLKKEGVSGAYIPINKDRGDIAKKALLRAEQIENLQ